MRGLIAAIVFVAAQLFAGVTAYAQIPAAGVVISSQAQCNYIDPATGLNRNSLSNIVNTIVLPVEALALTASQTVAATAGSIVLLPHVLTNSGNVTTSYRVFAANLAGDGFDVSSIRVIHDTNADGAVDATDVVITPADAITLAMGQSANILLEATVAANIAINLNANLLLTAESISTAITASNTDTIQVLFASSVTTVKSANAALVNRGDIVTYTLVATNSGTSAALPMAVSVDNAAQNGVLIRDQIPVNTSFSAFTNSGGGQPLYHIIGAPLHSYQSTAPVNLGDVDAIGLLFAAMPAGAAYSVSFAVSVHNNASGSFDNQATTFYSNGLGAMIAAPSNIVTVDVALVPPTISYFMDNTLTTPKSVMLLGEPLFIGADAATCNMDPLVAETHIIEIQSKLTGDTETFSFIETGPNTGTFSYTSAGGIPTVDANLNPVIWSNGVVETVSLDTLTSTIIDCGVLVTAKTSILVDPSGIVFDSISGKPLSGVTVSLIDITGLGNGGNAGGQATVFQLDGVTPAPSMVITDAQGKYHFPLVAPSTYSLQIAANPLPGYTFPSVVPVSQLPAGFNIVGGPNNVAGSASYGGSFDVSLASGAVVVDVPLDNPPAGALFVQKKAARSQVQLGEFLAYTIDVKNNTAVNMASITLSDKLPHGFVYVPGSLQRDGVKVADPVKSGGSTLDVAVGTLAANSTTAFTYRVQIGPGSLQGDGVNSAWASTPLIKSNVATAQVEITGGMMGDQAYLFGKVFLDCDENRVQGAEEIGVPDVRIYLEDGTFVITDAEGMWSLYGLKPQTHVLKIDDTTAPLAAKWINLSNRHGGVATTRFVDLKAGDWQRADFAISNCTQQIRKEVYLRRDEGEVQVAEIHRAMQQNFTVDKAVIAVGDLRGRAAYGLVAGNGVAGDYETTARTPELTAEQAHLPEKPVAERMRLLAEERIKEMGNGLDFIDLKDGDVLPYRQSNLVVKGKLGSRFELVANGKLIGAEHVGKKSRYAQGVVEVWEYIGVDLSAGENRLELKMFDYFGNERGSKAIRVTAPGELAEVRITVQESGEADGHSVNSVFVEMLDDKGVPVTVRIPVTLESSEGVWQAKDLNPAEAGVQVFMQGGKTEFGLISPQSRSKARIRVSSGILKAEAELPFLAPLRPMLAVGVLEGQVSVHDFNLKNIRPIRQRDSFEQELRLFAQTDGKSSIAGRAALFLKGRVLGQYLLTAAYDSDKGSKERMFRDIQPDEFYPIYGDSAIKGFDAQATTKLYVRLDKGHSWLLYGDFNAQDDTAAKKLSAYNRSLSGVREHYESGLISVDAFASQDSVTQVVEELAANGTSGPYYLAQGNAMLVNSEKVEIITRDRNQPALILQSESMQRFSDYQVDQVSQRLIFSQPIASVDARLNPRSIRVTYEIDRGGDRYWVAGVSAKSYLDEKLEIGASIVRDDNPQNKSLLSGIHTTMNFTENLVVEAEISRMSSDVLGLGKAGRIELRSHEGDLQTRLYVSNADTAFVNPNAYMQSGREEAGADLSYQLDEKTRLDSQFIRSKDKVTQGLRQGLMLSGTRKLGEWISVELGYRHSTETAAPTVISSVNTGEKQTNSLRTKVNSQIPGLVQLGLYGEYEQDLQRMDQKMAAVGADYQFANRGRFYARHEFISSLSGTYGLTGSQQNNATIVGIDSDYMQNGQIFSEYRARNAISGREAEAAVGLRNGWQVAEGLRFNTSLENIHALAGSNRNNSTALTGAVAYTANPLLKLSARTEARWSTAENSTLSSLSAAQKMNRDWALLASWAHSVRDRKAGGILTQQRARAGFAYRDVDSNHMGWLGMYERMQEKDSAKGSDRLSHLISTHLNYKPIRPWTLSGRYAVKLINEQGAGFADKSKLQLVTGRSMYDITERWDAGVVGHLLASNGFGNRYYGLGLETGYLLEANLWLSAGLNRFGFNDPEFLADSYTDKGFYVRLRYKFDETLFDAPKE